MKIKQKQVFEPITITLETKEEAQRFFDIVDKIDSSHVNAGGGELSINTNEYALIMELSDALKNGGVSL